MIVNTAYETQAHLLMGDSEYTPNYIYVEFVNDNASISPAVAATDTAAYYQTLNVEGSKQDYIQIPITLKPHSVTATQGGKQAVEFDVTTSGYTTGTFNKSFSTDSNSTIYSLGLVSKVPTSTGTKEILFARVVFDTDHRIIKTTSDMYISWKIEL